MNGKVHWDQVYAARAATQLSWFQAHATVSLQWIREAGVAASASIIDIGGGASTLVDDLLASGYEHLSVLDLSAAALTTVQRRLGDRATQVQWIEADILDAPLPPSDYDVWHDRAVFHFLGTDADRRAYVRQLHRALKPDGLLIVATFAEDGPSRCSGLPVTRYSIDTLQAQFGDDFRLVGHLQQSHITPSGAEQKFVYGQWRRSSA